MSITNPLMTDQEQERIQEAGQRLYSERLKPILEPRENGRMVVIHLETGDYAVEDTYPRALRSLRKTRPAGMMVALRIGPAFEAPAIYRAFAHRDSRQTAK